MAISTVDSSDPSLQLSSIPVVDLRFFSQSELNSLSLCSDSSFDLHRCDDLVVPKIDRSIFNESAGSRKQTYSRLRLARRPSDISTTLVSPRRRRRRPDLLPVSPLPDDSERRENDEIVFFLRNLFSGENSKNTPGKANSDKALVVYDKSSEIVNRNGVVVDVDALAKVEDPFGAELRRRTDGLAKEEEFLGFLEGLEGQWGSKRKKKKIVDAGDFGDVLPRGWKILLALKKREGRVSLNCRKYISPNGQQFESCKEVCSYLLSLFGPQDAGQPSSTHIDERIHVPSRSTAGLIRKDDHMSYSVTPVSSNAPISSVSTEHGKQVVLFSAENQVKAQVQQQDPIKCHMCKLTFDDKDAFVEHFLSFHRKKARKCGVSNSISDGVIMRDGKYECQFCHKIFDERHSYSDHVGIHVKYHGKSPEGLPDETSGQESNGQSSFAAMPSAISELDASVCIDKDKSPETSMATFSDELKTGAIHSKQAMENSAIGDSPKCGALEISQETLVSRSVDQHEMTDGKLHGPFENSNAKDVKVEPTLDTPTPLPTNEKNATCDASNVYLFCSSAIDEISESDNKLKRDLGEIGICDPSNEKDLLPGSVLDKISESGIKKERDLGENASCDTFNGKDLSPSSMLDEISELGDKPDKDLENHSINQPDNERTCGIEAYADDIFTSITKEPMLDETEKSCIEPVSGFESCSTSLPDTEKPFGMDECGNGIFTSSTKDTVLDKSEKSRNELKCSVGGIHSGSDEVAVTEIIGSDSEEKVLENVVGDTSSLLVQQSSFFTILDSDKGAHKFSSASLKLEKLSDFEELRFDDNDPPKFNFVNGQDSGSLSEARMDLAYDVEFEQGLDPSIQFEWDTVLPKMYGRHQLSAVCVWCGVESSLDDVNPEMHSDSVGFMCPNCKGKISGQPNVLDNDLYLNSDQL